MRSISKCVIGLLYGILLERGAVPSLETPVASLYAQHPELNQQPKNAIQIRHLLTMSAGLAWNEPSPVRRTRDDDQTSLVWTGDIYATVFGHEVQARPGETFVYSGGPHIGARRHHGEIHRPPPDRTGRSGTVSAPGHSRLDLDSRSAQPTNRLRRTSTASTRPSQNRGAGPSRWSVAGAAARAGSLDEGRHLHPARGEPGPGLWLPVVDQHADGGQPQATRDPGHRQWAANGCMWCPNSTWWWR